MLYLLYHYLLNIKIETETETIKLQPASHGKVIFITKINVSMNILNDTVIH